MWRDDWLCESVLQCMNVANEKERNHNETATRTEATASQGDATTKMYDPDYDIPNEATREADKKFLKQAKDVSEESGDKKTKVIK